MTTTSFFPAKPLGCYRDGGAILTEDDHLAEWVLSYRMHGQGVDKYDNVRIGMNSRLDTLQAAILSIKLAIFEEEITARNRIAARYSAQLGNQVGTPVVTDGYRSIWAQYMIRLRDAAERRSVQAALGTAGIPTAIYYPNPLQRQSAYAAFPADTMGMAATDAAAEQVLSLPMHPYLDEPTQDRIIAALTRSLTG